MELVRPGGLIAIGNTLWGGRVSELSFLRVGDGRTLCRKKSTRFVSLISFNKEEKEKEEKKRSRVREKIPH